MTDEDDVYTTCGWCGNNIAYGNASLSINRNIEQMDSTEEYPDGVVTVIDSNTLLELCAQCGNKLDPAMLKSILVALRPK